MTAVSISTSDLAPFATIDPGKAAAMIADAMAMAKLVAPCIVTADFAHPDAAKAIIRGAILRWNESGQGGLSQSTQTAGVFTQSDSFDNRQPRRAMFWPSEIEQLQKMCQAADSGGAWGYDTLGCATVQHADVCSANLGANYCSCGAILAGGPALWETE